MARLATQPLRPGRAAPNGTDSSNGAGPNGAEPGKPRTAPGRKTTKRNLPLVALGVLLVVGSAIGFSSAWLRASGHQQVLVVTGNLPAGHVLTSTDLKAVRISTGNGIAVVPASETSHLVGHPVALPLTSGALLTEADLGPSAGPPSGQSVVGLALKPGQYPPEIASGDQVLVVISGGSASSASSSSSSSSTDAPLDATVVGVEAAPVNSSDPVVVSLQLAEGSGPAVAAAGSAGNVTLAIVSPGGGS
jgi:hypothetical protein